MIPVLYDSLERDFTGNGLGRLSDCISCTVTEERNGIYECEFEYPITGRFYNYLINEPCYVACIHDDHHDIQPFKVYSYTAPIDGIVTFYAHHISYELNNVIVDDIDADTVADAFTQFGTKNITENRFSFWTDKTSSGSFKVKVPDSIRALLGGKEGSILDIYGGGEYEFDRYTVKLHAQRGINRGVTIRYGKNLADLKRSMDGSGTYNAVVPFWADEEGNTVTLPEYYIAETSAATVFPWEESAHGEVMQDGDDHDIEFRHFVLRAVPLDLSAEWQQEAPTVEQLRAKAIAWMTNNRPWSPSDNIQVNFVELWQSEEYENVAALQRVSLCDTVAIYYPELGVTNASAKVIRIVYNVLTEEYDEMELGEAKTNFADAIRGDINEQVGQALDESVNFTEQAIQRATELITGGLGGHVIMNLNADGEPQEILIMDTDNIATAVNVIRMNQNGIGFSHNGYEGPFESAWTIDGHFNADFIATGTILANFIQGGTLTLGGLNNNKGILVMLDGSGVETGRWNNQGIRLPVSDDPDDYASFSRTGFRISRQSSGMFGSTVIQHYAGGGDHPYAPADGTVLGLSGEYNETGKKWSIMLTPTGLDIGRYTGSGNNWGLRQGLSFDFTNGFSIRDDDQTRMLNYLFYPSADQLSLTGGIYAFGDIAGEQLFIRGYKNRVVKTKEYGERLLYCYETPSPLFGDVGEGTVDETGVCYVFLDAIFAETISTKQYQVFLQKYGDGDLWVAERKAGYFVVRGTPNLSFGWELKAKQFDGDDIRLNRKEKITTDRVDYGNLARQFIEDLEEGRMKVNENSDISDSVP